MARSPWRAVCVHGAGGGAWEWKIWSRHLHAHGIACDTMTLRPCEQGLAATCFADYQAQVEAAVLDAKSTTQRIVLIGASLGGLLALRAAHHADALVLINPMPAAPWHRELPMREFPDLMPWRSQARFDATHRALSDADAMSALFAHRHWRDESGAVLNEAYAGIEVDAPQCPRLSILSTQDEDIPCTLMQVMAQEWGADTFMLQSGHLGPLLGADAHHAVLQTVGWLNTLD